MKKITARELREYQEREDERSYLIIDVRQMAEYEKGHIPGSLILPLDEFEEQVDQLPEKHLVFYCRSGVRSYAAALTADFFNEAGKEIYNLEGGFLAWDGFDIKGIPLVERINIDMEMDAVLTSAMNLEKGAFLFYDHVMERYPETGLDHVVRQVRDGELGHAKLIYSHLKKIAPDCPSFEEIYTPLKGDILEGGHKLNEMLASLDRGSDNRKLNILETAVTMEYMAFDLYRVISEKVQDDNNEDNPLQEAFYSLSQAEKAHMKILLQCLEESL
ncbi:MAG: hypothetical protein HQK66_04630 [Desulfamplus sp.]|nr:hypothetical protein [Desulfamplus sp.]